MELRKTPAAVGVLHADGVALGILRPEALGVRLGCQIGIVAHQVKEDLLLRPAHQLEAVYGRGALLLLKILVDGPEEPLEYGVEIGIGDLGPRRCGIAASAQFFQHDLDVGISDAPG